jgi:hypothetical protein
MSAWYVRRGEKVIGPFESDKLQEFAASGKLLPTDLMAKDAGGPWKPASQSKLFAKQPDSIPSPVPTSIAPAQERLPAETKPPRESKVVIIGRGILISITTIGRGISAAGGALGRSLSASARRRHELKLAKIQAKAITDSQRIQQPTATGPITFAPQIVQTTVVKVINKNSGGCGCSGCGTLLLLIILGVAAAVYFSNAKPTTNAPPTSQSTR